jgi:hypothetical protein
MAFFQGLRNGLRLLRPRARFEQNGSHRPLTPCIAIPPLFGLAPCGVCPAPCITARAVRSYRTFSPLPQASTRGLRMACACFALASGSSEPALAVRSPGPRRYIFCGTFRQAALKPPSRTLSGTLLCGVRTFLSPGRAARGPHSRADFAREWVETRRPQPGQRPSGPTSTIHIIR